MINLGLQVGAFVIAVHEAKMTNGSSDRSTEKEVIYTG